MFVRFIVFDWFVTYGLKVLLACKYDMKTKAMLFVRLCAITNVRSVTKNEDEMSHKENDIIACR